MTILKKSLLLLFGCIITSAGAMDSETKKDVAVTATTSEAFTTAILEWSVHSIYGKASVYMPSTTTTRSLNVPPVKHPEFRPWDDPNPDAPVRLLPPGVRRPAYRNSALQGRGIGHHLLRHASKTSGPKTLDLD